MSGKRMRVALGAAALILIALVAGSALYLRPAPPMPEALAALQSDAQVTVRSDRWLAFQPQTTPPAAGFIFYPGGLVDPRAYAPAAHAIAAQGYLVVIVPMPLNLAFFDSNRAAEVIQSYGAVHHWTIGGHSLGGVAAAMFVQSHPGAVDGLAFWASYPAGDLSGVSVHVLSISGTRDGLSTPEKIAASRAQLPAGTRWLPIEGGNHAQFGWYGPQSGDHDATIARAEQQQQIVSGMVEWLRGIAAATAQLQETSR